MPPVAAPVTQDANKDRAAPETTSGDTVAAPPKDCPAVYNPKVLELDEDLQKIFAHFRVPWLVQFFVSSMGYTASRDVAMRWDKDTDHVAMSRTLGVFSGQNGYDDESSRLAVIKFCNAVEQCVTDKKRKHSELSTTALTDFQAMLGRGDRGELRAAYKALNGEDPPVEEEGSDHFLGVFKRTFARDEFPTGNNLNESVIVAHHHQEGEVKYQKPKTTKDGEQYVEEEANPAWGKEHWQRRIKIFRTTLLMSSAGAVHCPRLKLTKKKLDKLYKFIEGDDIMKSPLKPRLGLIIEAERKVWRHIALRLSREDPDTGKPRTLSDEIDEVIKNTHFWNNNILIPSQVSAKAAGTPKGAQKGDKTSKGGQKGDKSPKGKGKGKDQGKWQGKKKKGYQGGYNQPSAPLQPNQQSPQAPAAGAPAPPSAPAQWMKTHPKSGKEFCKKFHAFNNCPGNCGRSHVCPVIKSDGSPCLEQHRAADHK